MKKAPVEHIEIIQRNGEFHVSAAHWDGSQTILSWGFETWEASEDCAKKLIATFGIPFKKQGFNTVIVHNRPRYLAPVRELEVSTSESRLLVWAKHWDGECTTLPWPFPDRTIAERYTAIIAEAFGVNLVSKEFPSNTDTDRLNWLSKLDLSSISMYLAADMPFDGDVFIHWDDPGTGKELQAHGATIRDAIDAAIATCASLIERRRP